MTLRLLVLGCAMTLVAVACGGSSDASGNVASVDDVAGAQAEQGGESLPAEEVDTEAAFLGLAQCLRDEGIAVSDPQVDADGNVDLQGMFEAAEDLDQAEIEAAAEACAEFIEDVVPTFSDIDLTQLQDDLLEFAGCMRDQGFDMPDPDFTNFGIPGGDEPNAGPFGEIDVNDPAFEPALGACQDILAGLVGPGGAGEGG